MSPSSLIVILLVSFTIIDAEYTWSEWVETPDAQCSDICGYCGLRVTASRSCSTLGKCSGVAQRYEECGSKMCSFPRNTCCPGYVKGLLGDNITFECVAASAVLAAKTKMT